MFYNIQWINFANLTMPHIKLDIADVVLVQLNVYTSIVYFASENTVTDI